MAHWLSRRDRRPEWMDQPDVDPAEHAFALRGLARINAWSRSDAILWPGIQGAAREAHRAVRVLDVASGGGDVLFALERRARTAHLSIEWLGLDRSPEAVDLANQQATALGSKVQFEVRDVLVGSLPQADVVCTSLFLHHLEEEQAVLLLRRLLEAAPLVLVNDLRRCRLGYYVAVVVTRLLTWSPMVHHDGPLSVQGAFTLTEALALAREAGWTNATVAWRWPFRYLLTGRRT